MKSLLTKKGLKITKARLKVLNILQKAKNPLTAEEIYLQCDKDINLSTVYRILDIFLEKNIVTKPLIKENLAACYTINYHEHRHYIICIKCQKITDIEFCPFSEIENKIIQETKFLITNHKFELTGICPKCQNS